MHLQHLLAVIYEELPSRFAARLESRLRQEHAAGRLGTTPPRPAPSLAEIMRELPLHNHRLDLTAEALGTTEAKVRRALGDRLKPPKPKTQERDFFSRTMR